MLVFHKIGLDVEREEERAVLRAAALACGLEPVELLPGHAAGDIDTVEAWRRSETSLPFVVTDRQVTNGGEDARETPAGGGANPFPSYQAPVMILVRDRGQAEEEPAESAFAWVLERPLRVQEVQAQLGQLLRANDTLLRQNQIMSEELRLTRRIFDSVRNGITICDVNLPDLPLVYVNPAFERITGYAASEICGHNCRMLQGPETDQVARAKVRRAILEEREEHVVLRNYRKDGTTFWNELYLSPVRDQEGQLTHFVGIQNEVTAQVEAEQELSYLANHDALTGLVNRRRLLENLEQAVQRAKRSGKDGAVLFFDLTNFKHVNDTCGHDAGDRLLKLVAERLRAGTRTGETVARLGGDEFVVVVEELSEDRQPEEIMQRLRQTIGQVAEMMEQPFHPTASVGMARFPRDGTSPEELLRVADFQMYLVKHQARQRKLMQELGSKAGG
jgi:diguanylate cyclase (GGDEF)-like protein/PAS domain S-box-containing protein